MKIHVNKLSAAFVFAALASTASFSQTKVWTVSSVIPQNTKSAGNLQSFCLNKNSGAWEVIEKCNVDLQGYELIYADPIKRIFQLASPKPSRISERPGSVGGECFYGVFGTSSREKNGYNICNSALAKGGTNVGEAVIGNIVNLAMGTVRKIMVVDQDAVLKAATEAGLQKLAYQKAFTDLTNITVLKNLIDVYKDDDGSGLIPQAQERLKNLELALEASNQKEKDDNEVRVNLLAEEKQKQMVLANELEAKLNERLNTWRSTIQIGEICLVGPLNTGFNQKVYLKALVIDKRNPLIQVQYDGSTNDPKTNVSLSSRVEWVQIKSLFPADTKFQ